MDERRKTPLSEGEQAGPDGLRPVESRDLLDARGELLIRHEGRLYRLRRTRLGKLILTA